MSQFSKFVLCGSFLIATQVSIASDDENAILAKADEMLNKGKARQAATLMRDLIQAHPDNATAHMELGAALASLAENDNYAEAIAEEEQAIKLDPKCYGARKILGHIYANQKKYTDSIKMLEEACALNPNSYTSKKDLGIAQMSAGKNTEALKSFEAAAKLRPEKVEPHIRMSNIFLKEDRYKEAVAQGRAAVKLDISNPETHLALGNALLAYGDKAASVEPFEKAMETNSVKAYRNPITQASALSGLGWAYSGAGASTQNLNEGIANQQKALKLFPGFGPAHVRLAELLAMQGKNKEADTIYQNAMKYSGDDPSVASAYAKFLDKTGHKAEAKTLLNKILEKAPENKPAKTALDEISK